MFYKTEPRTCTASNLKLRINGDTWIARPLWSILLSALKVFLIRKGVVVCDACPGPPLCFVGVGFAGMLGALIFPATFK